MPEGIFSALGVLAVIAIILGLTYWFTKYVVGRGFRSAPGVSTGGTFSVLGQLTLGKGQRLIIVRLGERCLLLGVTMEQVSLLAELTPEETLLFTKPGASENDKVNFLETMRGMISQKK